MFLSSDEFNFNTSSKLWKLEWNHQNPNIRYFQYFPYSHCLKRTLLEMMRNFDKLRRSFLSVTELNFFIWNVRLIYSTLCQKPNWRDTIISIKKIIFHLIIENFIFELLLQIKHKLSTLKRYIDRKNIHMQRNQPKQYIYLIFHSWYPMKHKENRRIKITK